MDCSEAKPTKVFISYSHDSVHHESAVLALSDRLRSDGVDSVLDQYEDFPLQGWPLWMQQQVQAADFVLVVCTKTYRRRADAEEQLGTGLGATWEARLIRQLLYNSAGINTRFIPVLCTITDRDHIPLVLQGYTYFIFDSDEGYSRLLRFLTGRPHVAKPALGALHQRETKPDFRKVVWNVPPRNPFFTGREEQLVALRNTLVLTGSAAIGQPQAISGLGGIGKTHTAIEYVHRYGGHYAATLWLPADSRDSLGSGCVALANLLGLPDKVEKDLNRVIEAVRGWLESQSGWLLVLDNVENLVEIVHSVMPRRATGQILITTRLQATGSIAQSVQIEKMSLEEGSLFLLRRSKTIAQDAPLASAHEEDRTAAKQISAEVAGLPLALDQAGAFIEEVPSTLAEYLELYRNEGAQLRAIRGAAASDHESVTVTFSLAFKRASGNSAAAGDLIRVCAFLAPDEIPETLFSQNAMHFGEELGRVATNAFEFAETLKEAGRFSLVRRNPARKTLSIHRVVQTVVRDEMTAEGQRLWAGRIVEALAQAFPPPDYENWSRCEQLVSHAVEAAKLVERWRFESIAAARLLGNVGRYLQERASYEEAMPLLDRAIVLFEKVLGVNHPDTARSLSELAVLYRNQGRYAEATPLFGRALAIFEKAQNPAQPDTAKILRHLGELCRYRGLYEETERLYRRALAIFEKTLGEDHPETAITLSNLGVLYRFQLRYSDAAPLYERALAIFENKLGSDHPDTAIALNSLAVLYRYQDRYEEAASLFQRALAIFERTWGTEHPNTATVLHNLAVLYRKQSRYDEATPLFNRALIIRERRLVPEHPDIGLSLSDIAVLHHKQGRYEEAAILFQRALGIFEKVQGAGHPHTATVAHGYAALMREMGHEKDAANLEKRFVGQADQPK